VTQKAPDISLLSIAHSPPLDAESMLLELGNGDSGFAGTPVGTGEATLDEFIEHCRAQAQGQNLSEGWVPSTTHWIVVDRKAAGLLRLRHYLNDALRRKGGHIGYYVRPTCRGRGVATQSLALALPLAKALGEARVLLTTNPTNTHSIRVIEANGGALAATLNEQTDSNQSTTTETILQYWIDT